MAAPTPGFVFGFAAAMRGGRLALGVPEIRRAYVALSLSVMALAAVLDVLGIGGLWTAVDAAGLASWLAWLLKLVGTALVLLTAPLVAILLIGLVVPLLAERVFLNALRHVDRGLAIELERAPGPGRLRGLWTSARRMVTFVLATALAFMVALIPWIGPLVGPAIQAFVTARFLGWELLEPYFDHRGCDYTRQRTFVSDHAATIVGFSLPYSFALAIPLFGPLLFGVAQAAAAELVADLERSGVRP